MTPGERIDEIEARLEMFGLWHETCRDGVTAQDVRDLIRQLRDVRAGSITANEILGRIHDALGLGWNPADDDHAATWCDSEDTVQAVIRSASELRDARAEIERWRAEFTERCRMQAEQIERADLAEAELAAEREKVQRVEALCGVRIAGAAADAVLGALAGGEQGE